MTDPVYVLSQDDHTTLHLSMATHTPDPDTPATPDQGTEVLEVYTDIDTAARDAVAHLQCRMGWPPN